MEFVCVIRFAKFKKKLGASHKNSILKDHSSSRVRILYLELFLEVNKPFATDLFAFGNDLF